MRQTPMIIKKISENQVVSKRSKCQCDIIADITIKNTFSGIICDDHFISGEKINPYEAFRNFQYGRQSSFLTGCCSQR